MRYFRKEDRTGREGGREAMEIPEPAVMGG